VFLIYYLHQRSLSNVQGKGEAEREASKQNTLLVSEAPADSENLNSLSNTAVNCSPTVRLNEADLEVLRGEVFKIADDVISSKNFRDAAEGMPSAWPILSLEDELPQDSQILRLSDEQNVPNPISNIPGVQDIHAELREYTEHMLETWTSDFSKAKKRQHRPTAAELDINSLDTLEDVASLPNRIAFLDELMTTLAAEAAEKTDPENTTAITNKAAIATTTSVDLLGVRREILPWLQYHTEIGVSKFYILYDGNDSKAVEALRSINHIEILHLHKPWSTPAERVLWEAHLNLSKLQWQETQGNYELMAKQGFCLAQALRRARESKMDWLIHLDPDELFLPGGNEASIQRELSKIPLSIPAVRFLNFEAQPEAGDVQNPYEQITLFRAHKHFITPEAFWYRNRFKLGENAAFLYLYANGKSAVRVNAEGVRAAGPHYFLGDASERWKSIENPSGLWVNAVSDTSIVLHYAYSRPSEVAAKAQRSCPRSFTAAGNRDAVKKSCFIIEFDADAFMAAVQGEDAINDFYFSRMVLSEGVAVRCERKPDASGLVGGQAGWCALSNIPRFIHLMEKIGLMKRVLLPQAILRQQERIIKNFYNNFSTRPLDRN
jgi:hypothetical protein